MSIQPGHKLGNYQVLSTLGTGGMGVVYLAEHPLIGKKVALKVMHSDLAARPDVLARFANEARAVGKVAGEHVVQIHDFGEAPDGSFFFVMEYLEGHTLASELAGERSLSVERTLFIAAQLASALAAVHSSELLHRDLKPDNVMLVERNGTRDFVVLLDFGLVKFLGDDAANKNLTGKGMLLGTPQYMSPEACRGKGDLDHRTDQYALGVLIFQMLTGRLPFSAPSTGALLAKHLSDAPPALRSLSPGVPVAVEQIVMRCMAKDREQRFADMDALRSALEQPEAYLASVAPGLPTLTGAVEEGARAQIAKARNKTVGLFAAQAPASAPASAPSAGRAAASGPAAASAPSAGSDPVPARVAAGKRATIVGTPPAPASELVTRGPAPDAGARAERSASPAVPVETVPRRRAWPALAAVVAVAAGTAALVFATRTSSPSHASGAGSPAPAEVDEAPAPASRSAGDAGRADLVPSADAGVAAVPERAAVADGGVAAVPERAAVADGGTIRLRVVTRPAGAQVVAENGDVLGETPLDREIARAQGPLTLLLRHPRASDKHKTIDGTRDVAIDVDLPPKRSKGQGPRRRVRKRRDAVLRPTL